MRKAAVAVAVGGGRGKGAATTTDLLVCFPARQRLALMPKPICSPSRATMDKAAASGRRRSQMPGARSSPMFRGSKAKCKAGNDDEEEEPQSPKVTCAGQIKVSRPKKTRTAAGKLRGKGGGGGEKSWITVVEEIERMHGRRKKVGWLEAVGIKRDALPFLGGVLRSLRHKARCLGSFHGAVDSSTDDGDGDGAEEERDVERCAASGSAAASVFSKWLMVLEGGGEEPLEQNSRDDEERDREDHEERHNKEADECSSAPPPPNALLLMRCRSAPAKGLCRRGAAEPMASEAAEEEKGSAHAIAEDAGTEEDKNDLVFMSTAPGFLKLSIDIAKETWLVGGGDPLSRSRSWKR